MLLPPKIVGPINTLSTSVAVVGPVPGSSVQLFVDDIPVGGVVTAGGLSVSIPLTAPLAPGARVAATQSANGATSALTPIPEVVSKAPSAASEIPPLTILSGLDTCIDWVLVDGAIPGATVTVLFEGQPVGTGVAEGPKVSVPVSFPHVPAGGTVLRVVQEVAGMAGQAVDSLPLSPVTSRQRQIPTISAPFECDLAVLVSGLQEGASLIVRQGSDDLAGYPFVGSSAWAQLREPARVPALFAVRQQSRQCGLSSGLSPAVGINPALRLPTPIIVGPVCPNAQLLRVRNLRPGAIVTVQVNRNEATTGRGSLVGHATAWATDCDLPLPDGWADQLAPPGILQIEVYQENCGKGSVPAYSDVEPLPGAVGEPSVDAPVECARWIVAHGLSPGAWVRVLSDQAGASLLSGAQLVGAADLGIALYRPLRPTETIKVVQSGCNVGAASRDTPVTRLLDLAAPKIVGPVRIIHNGFNVTGLVVGARAHVFVNHDWHSSFDAIATATFVPITGLHRGVEVHVRQALCARISDQSNVETAVPGEMTVSVAPSGSIERGTAKQITVFAQDRELGSPVSGRVVIGTAVVGTTGTPFIHTFALGQPAPASAVDADDYKQCPILWLLVDPAPPVAKQLRLSIVNQAPSFFSIAGVKWSIERQELNGTYTLVAAPTGVSVAVTPPTTGQYHIYAAVSVADLINGGTVLAEFRGNAIINGFGTLLVVWTGAEQSGRFRLIAEPTVASAGGTQWTIYNPVVLL